MLQKQRREVWIRVSDFAGTLACPDEAQASIVLGEVWRPQRLPVGTRSLCGFNKSTGFGALPDPLLALQETLTVGP